MDSIEYVNSSALPVLGYLYNSTLNCFLVVSLRDSPSSTAN